MLFRSTAIRSFFHYAAYEEPAHAAQIQRVLAIPGKRCIKALVKFLDRTETEALLKAPDPPPYPQVWAARKWLPLALTRFTGALSWRARSIRSHTDDRTMMNQRRQKFQSASE